MTINLMPLPAVHVGQTNPLDFSPVQNALANYSKGTEKAYEGETDKLIGNALAGPGGIEGARKIAAQRGNLETNLGLAKFGMQQRAEGREEETFQDTRLQKAELQMGKLGEMVAAETDPAKKAMLRDKVIGSDPRLAEAWKKMNLPAEIANDPDVWAKYVMARAAPYRDKLAREQLESDTEKNRAQAEAARAQAANEQFKPVPENAPGVFSGRTGEVRALPEGADPSARIIAKKAAEEQGKALGNARVALPEALRAADTMVTHIDALTKDPSLKNVTGGFQGMLPKWTHTEGQARAQSRVNEVQGGTFLQAFNTLKGGGQITEKEGEKATASLNRLGTQTMGDKDYQAALQEFRSEVLKLAELAKQRATAPGAAQQQQQSNQPQRAPDGNLYIPDPNRPGKYLRVDQ